MSDQIKIFYVIVEVYTDNVPRIASKTFSNKEAVENKAQRMARSFPNSEFIVMKSVSSFVHREGEPLGINTIPLQQV